MQVSFFLGGGADLAQLSRLDPDRDYREFQTGERAWILQTYLRLRAAGHPATLTSEVPEQGIVVFTSKQRRELRRVARAPGRLLVGVREDVASAVMADCEVLQNGRFADGVTRFFVPLWPQPGLLARDPARGRTLKCISYKGFAGNLHADFRGEQWSRDLAARGIEWRFDAIEYRGPQAEPQQGSDWQDFRDVDLLLAVRPRTRDRYLRKPATKLSNAWIAGVPALLGPEYAYRELRRDELDYVEVANAEQSLRAIDRLREDPARYAGMIENGRFRGRDFTSAAILARWAKLLFEVLPERMSHPAVQLRRRRPLWLRSGVQRMQRLLGRNDQ